MTDLTEKRCLPCEAGVKPLSSDEARALLKQLDNWEYHEEKQLIYKAYTFKGFYKTMSFVNAVAWVANSENHHPDMSVGYNYCNISLQTHAINGLSENDFIVAAKIDALFPARSLKYDI